MEGDLHRLAADQPGLRIVRLRPGLIFQRSAATEIRRLFAERLTDRPQRFHRRVGRISVFTTRAELARRPGLSGCG